MTQPAGRPMILAEGLQKHFGSTHALAGLDLDVAEGTILALLGPNGAGKTTAVRILTTLLRPDAGRAEVAGIDVLKHPAAVRGKMGLAGQDATRAGGRGAGAGSQRPPRAACAVDWPWGAPAWGSRRSSSWTSRPPASIRAVAWGCG